MRGKEQSCGRRITGKIIEQAKNCGREGLRPRGALNVGALLVTPCTPLGHIPTQKVEKDKREMRKNGKGSWMSLKARIEAMASVGSFRAAGSGPREALNYEWELVHCSPCCPDWPKHAKVGNRNARGFSQKRVVSLVAKTLFRF